MGVCKNKVGAAPLPLYFYAPIFVHAIAALLRSCYTEVMLKVVRFLLAFVPCFSIGSSLLAQLLPGQLPRQSPAGGLIYRSLFDRTMDAEDNDGFPDHWTRKEGIDNDILFPVHINIAIAENPNPFGNYVLRMNMEGGAAAVFSPKIPIRTGMSYTVSTHVESSNTVFNEIFIRILFYGNNTARPIHIEDSRKIGNTNGWQRISVGPITADMPNVTSVAVGLYVTPTGRQDFGSQVNFTNVEIRESPAVSLEMANTEHLFSSHRGLDARCQFRGLDPKQHTVLFILEDVFGNIIRQREFDLMIGNHPASQFIITPQNVHNIIHGAATWRDLPILSPGFYKVRVATPESYIQTLRLPADQTFDDPLGNIEPLTFAVMSPGSFRAGGDFGWSLDGWTLDDIIKTMPTISQSGLSRLKLPVWITTETTPQHREDLLHLCNRLSQQQVQLIGLLQPVPPDIVQKIPTNQINAAMILGNNPQSWGESLQLSLRTLSLLIKDWQWTSDNDSSLVDQFFDYTGSMPPAGEARFSAFQRAFDRNQFGFGIGMAWNWYQQVPDEEFPLTNFFLNFSVDSSVTSEYAASALAGMSSLPFRRLVSVSPLPADDYTLETRITDFVQSLVLLKAAGVDGIFLAAPKNEQTGILRQNGTPNELYLPWRTTATLLTGSRLLGSITLPNRSRNYCFDLGAGRCVMVVWNDWATADKPVLETLYLGNELDTIDVWGKHASPEQLGNNQTISVTQTPIFVIGVNIDVVRFRLSMQTLLDRIPATPNRKHTIPIFYRNDSASPISIQITPQPPRPIDWTITPPTLTGSLEQGAEGLGSFELTLLPRADTGRRLFQYNVLITGINAPEFAVYDEMMVGDPDVYMEFVTRMTEGGDLEVIQVFVNNTESVYTYSCRLTVPTRSGQKHQVRRQGFGRAEHVYVIPRGRALLDSGVSEIMLRADPENDGSGVRGEPMVYTISLVEE